MAHLSVLRSQCLSQPSTGLPLDLWDHLYNKREVVEAEGADKTEDKITEAETIASKAEEAEAVVVRFQIISIS